MADDEALARVVERVLAEPVYALDTEFHRERTYHARLALVQLGWPGGIALVDPLAVDVAPLAAVLSGDGVAVLHAAEQDLEVLRRVCGTVPGRLFDTQMAARFVGFTATSLAALAHALLDVHLPKGDRLTDWLRRPLSDAQRSYAAADVAHLLDVHAALVQRLEAAARLRWAEEEYAELRRRALDDGDPRAAWWRIKDARSLRGRSRGIAQAVAAWREERAARVDTPVRHVLPDLALLAVVHAAPTTSQELRRLRGLEGRSLGTEAERELLAAVVRGSELPPAELCVPPTDVVDRTLRPATTLVAAWLAQRAGELGIDVSLLGTRADIAALLRGDRDARLATGWRGPIVAEPIRRLVAGDLALAFEGTGGLVLEERSRRRATLD